MDVGNKIKSLRLSKGLTQDELASLVGLKKAAIHKYENGLVENIKRSTLQSLADIFEVSPSYLLGWENTKVKIEPVLKTKEEEDILNDFNKLNSLGKKEASKRISELTEIAKYTSIDE